MMVSPAAKDWGTRTEVLKEEQKYNQRNKSGMFLTISFSETKTDLEKKNTCFENHKNQHKKWVKIATNWM